MPEIKCPVCKELAKMQFRDEQDSDGPGNTVFAYMECCSCGIRSRELIAVMINKQKLVEEWSVK